MSTLKTHKTLRPHTQLLLFIMCFIIQIEKKEALKNLRTNPPKKDIDTNIRNFGRNKY